MRLFGITIWQWETITRADNDPYLTRLMIFNCAWFKIMLHWFVGSDDECLHDHPWSFISFIVRGGYWEHVQFKDPYCLLCKGELRRLDGKEGACPACLTKRTKTWYKAGSLLLRPAATAHRIEIGTRPTVTLVITGPKVRAWGFWTLSGWRWWKDYRWREHCPA